MNSQRVTRNRVVFKDKTNVNICMAPVLGKKSENSDIILKSRTRNKTQNVEPKYQCKQRVSKSNKLESFKTESNKIKDVAAKETKIPEISVVEKLEQYTFADENTTTNTKKKKCVTKRKQCRKDENISPVPDLKKIKGNKDILSETQGHIITNSKKLESIKRQSNKMNAVAAKEAKAETSIEKKLEEYTFSDDSATTSKTKKKKCVTKRKQSRKDENISPIQDLKKINSKKRVHVEPQGCKKKGTSPLREIKSNDVAFSTPPVKPVQLKVSTPAYEFKRPLRSSTEIKNPGTYARNLKPRSVVNKAVKSVLQSTLVDIDTQDFENSLHCDNELYMKINEISRIAGSDSEQQNSSENVSSDNSIANSENLSDTKNLKTNLVQTKINKYFSGKDLTSTTALKKNSGTGNVSRQKFKRGKYQSAKVLSSNYNAQNYFGFDDELDFENTVSHIKPDAKTTDGPWRCILYDELYKIKKLNALYLKQSILEQNNTTINKNITKTDRNEEHNKTELHLANAENTELYAVEKADCSKPVKKDKKVQFVQKKLTDITQTQRPRTRRVNKVVQYQEPNSLEESTLFMDVDATVVRTKTNRRSYERKFKPEPAEDEPSSEQIILEMDKKKLTKSKPKKAKKDEKLLESWTKDMNSMFDEVENFELHVEA